MTTRPTRRLVSLPATLGALAALAIAHAPRTAQAQVPPGLACGSGANPLCVARVSDTIEFEAPFSQITVDPAAGSFVMTGDVTLRSPGGDLPLVESEIAFLPSNTIETFDFEVYGYVMAPLPALPLFEGAEIRYEPRAAIGVVSRATLQEMFAADPLPLAENFVTDANGQVQLDANGQPVLREPGYVVFHYESSPQLELPLDQLLAGAVGLTAGDTNPFRFDLPSRSLTFVVDPADPYFFYSSDRSAKLERKDENGNPIEESPIVVDPELLALQDSTAAALDDLIANGQLDPAAERRIRSARERVYRLDAAQLTGLTNDALASYTGTPAPETVAALTDVRAASADLDRRRHFRPLAQDGSDPGLTVDAMDYAVPALVLDNRPLDRNPDALRDVDVQLRRLQDRTAAGLDAMLDANAFADADRALFEQARADVYRLDAAQLAGVSNEMLATYANTVDPATVDRIVVAMDDSSALHRDRTGRDPSPEDADFRTPRVQDSTSPDDSNNNDWSTLAELTELGFSWNGGIPFAPDTTWGLPSGAGEFKGHLYLKAEVPIHPGIVLNGPSVWSIDASGFEVGGNGNVDVDISAGPLGFGFALGHASAGVALVADGPEAYFSGEYAPDLSWLPKEVPFTPANAGRLAGFVSAAHPENTRLMAEGSYGYDTAGLSALVGVQLDDIVLAQASMSISPTGVFVQGSSSASIHPSLATGAALDVRTLVSIANPASSYLQMTGAMEIAGVGISPAILHAGAQGLLVNGAFTTPLSTIALTGEVTNAGPSLTGAAQIVIPLGAITQAAADAADEVASARADVARASVALADMRAIVQAERDRDARNLALAQQGVDIAQSAVDSLNAQIASYYRSISSYNKAISSKYAWYQRQAWYNKTWAWADYAATRSYYTARIAAAYTAIAGLEAAKWTATQALTAAQYTLSGVQAGMALFPIDADPRVAGLIVGLETAEFTLAQTEAVLGAVPQVNADIVGTIDVTLDTAGIRGTLNATANGLQLTSGRVTFGASPEACISLATVGEVCAPF